MAVSKLYIESIKIAKATWGDEILTELILTDVEEMSFADFLTYCSGDESYSKIFLSGIKRLYPYVWKVVVEKGNEDLYALCSLLVLLGIESVFKKGEKIMNKEWERNARIVEYVFGGYVDREEKFYICPECGDAIYECDWDEEDFIKFLCPVCEFNGEEE